MEGFNRLTICQGPGANDRQRLPMLQALRHGVFRNAPHRQILLDRRQTVLRAPHDHLICTQRKENHRDIRRQRDNATWCAASVVSPVVTVSARRWRRSVAPDWRCSPDGCACTRRGHCALRTLHVGRAGPVPHRPRARLLCRPAWRRNETHDRAPFPRPPDRHVFCIALMVR